MTVALSSHKFVTADTPTTSCARDPILNALTDQHAEEQDTATSQKLRRGKKRSRSVAAQERVVSPPETSNAQAQADLLRTVRKLHRRIITLEQEAIAARKQSAAKDLKLAAHARKRTATARELAVKERQLSSSRMRQQAFRDHLNAEGILIPGTDGRTMQPDLEQVKQYGPDCHVCGLSGHWRDVCPHGPIY